MLIEQSNPINSLDYDAYMQLVTNRGKIQRDDNNKTLNSEGKPLKESRIGCWSWGNHIYYYEKESNLRSYTLFHAQRLIYYIFSKIGLTHDAYSDAFNTLKQGVIRKFDATNNPNQVGRVAALTIRTSDLTKEVATLTKTLKKEQNDKSALQATLKETPKLDAFHRLERKYASSKALALEYEEKFEDSASAMDSDFNKIVELEKHIENLNNTATAHQNEKLALEQKITELTTTVQNSRQELAKLEEKCTTYKKAMEEGFSNLTTEYESKIKKLKTELATKSASNEELNSEILHNKQLQNTLQEEKNAQRAEFIEQTSEGINQNELKLAELKEQHQKTLEAANSTYNKKLEGLENINHKLTINIVQFKDEIAKLRENEAELRREITVLTEGLAESKNTTKLFDESQEKAGEAIKEKVGESAESVNV
jgi:chromosome segregation ATPase